MLTEYLEAAMARAEYEVLGGGAGYYGCVPGLDGLWGQAATLEACRVDLRAALEGWVLLGLRQGSRLPALDGIDLCAEPAVG